MIVKKTLERTLGIIGFLIFWQVISEVAENPALPSVGKIMQKLLDVLSDEKTIIHVWATMKIVLIAICAATAFGVILAVLMSLFEAVYNAMMPLIECLRGIGALTLFPLLIVLFGLSDAARIFVLFWTAWPAVLISTLNGLKTDQDIVNAAMNCGANNWQTHLYVRIPLAMPYIANGVRIGISGGMVGVATSEMLGASKGLGFMVQWMAQSFRFGEVYAYIILLAVLGGIINWLMLAFERKLRRIIEL